MYGEIPEQTVQTQITLLWSESTFFLKSVISFFSYFQFGYVSLTTQSTAES